MIIFKNRLDAGAKLAEKIHLGKDDRNPIVLGIPRGGIAVGYPIALKLNSVASAFPAACCGVSERMTNDAIP